MPITFTDKTVSPAAIPAGGTARVTLTVHAAASAADSAPGASNVHIREQVTEGLTILSVDPPALGAARIEDAHSLSWHIPALAPAGEQTASLTFTVQHTGSWLGDLFVNESVALSDDAGEEVTFPEPILTVYEAPGPEPEPGCGDTVSLPCPPAVTVTACGCQQAACVDVGQVQLEGTARLLCLNMTVRGLCPGTRTALGVLVKALGPAGESRGCAFKTVILPAMALDPCQPVTVKGIRLVMPADTGCEAARAAQRFEVRVFANCIDYACEGLCGDAGGSESAGGCGCGGTCGGCEGCGAACTRCAR